MSDVEPFTLDVRQVGVAESVHQWSKHQRERGAELVTDIGEESGLGAVDLD